MSKFKWEPEYAVGHDVIDGQHRQIIDILNTLYDTLKASGSERSATVEAVFERLAGYVTNHFSYEEALMAANGYPSDKLAAHKLLHDELLAEVQRIAVAYHNGDQASLDDLLPFLYGNWLLEHIGTADRDYSAYVAA